MSEQAELAFVKSFANALSSQPVVYGNDYQQAPENELKKVPVLARHAPASVPADSISITFKSTKPVQAYTLNVQPTDTIAQIKAQLAAVPSAPPVDAQRLLLKGKALADAKLLREYAVKDGDTVNLMVKPGFEWDPSKLPQPSSSAPATVSASPSAQLKALPESESVTLLPSPEPRTRQGHGRIPPGEKLVDIPLVLDTSSIPASPSTTVSDTPYHATLSKPEFWEKMHTFLATQFSNPSDVATAWEDFFCVSKGNLSVNEIAKIRDAVGVIGMAGT